MAPDSVRRTGLAQRTRISGRTCHSSYLVRRVRPCKQRQSTRSSARDGPRSIGRGVVCRKCVSARTVDSYRPMLRPRLRGWPPGRAHSVMLHGCSIKLVWVQSAVYFTKSMKPELQAACSAMQCGAESVCGVCGGAELCGSAWQPARKRDPARSSLVEQGPGSVNGTAQVYRLRCRCRACPCSLRPHPVPHRQCNVQGSQSQWLHQCARGEGYQGPARISGQAGRCRGPAVQKAAPQSRRNRAQTMAA